MKRSKALGSALMIVSLLLVLGACSDSSGAAETWGGVTSPSQLTGTWTGDIVVTIPAKGSAPQYNQPVGGTLTYSGTTLTVVTTVDMSGLFEAMSISGAAADSAWAEWAVDTEQAATLDSATGMTTTITCSDSSPYITTTTTTGAVTDLQAAGMSGIEINSSGTQIHLPMDEVQTGLTSLALTKQ